MANLLKHYRALDRIRCLNECACTVPCACENECPTPTPVVTTPASTTPASTTPAATTPAITTPAGTTAPPVTTTPAVLSPTPPSCVDCTPFNFDTATVVPGVASCPTGDEAYNFNISWSGCNVPSTQLILRIINDFNNDQSFFPATSPFTADVCFAANSTRFTARLICNQNEFVLAEQVLNLPPVV